LVIDGEKTAMYHIDKRSLRQNAWTGRILFCLIVLLLTCVKEYNPFEDYSNVNVHIEYQSFQNGNRISIFSPETLCVATLVGEKLDSFTLNAAGNIFWRDSTVRKGNGDFQKKYFFLLSFNDTGFKEIIIRAYPTGAAPKQTQKLSLTVFSPLHQVPVSMYLGTPCTLSTPPVPYKNVLYHWYFGRGVQVTNRDPFYSAVFYQAPDTVRCSLWVSDLRQEYSSQKVPFSARIIDALAPVITCKNSNVTIQNDTVSTADSTFIFIVEITDQGNMPVVKASINAGAFSDREPSRNRYWKIVETMNFYTKKSPFTAAIHAEDHYGNITDKTYWLCFDSLQQQTDAILLTLDNIDSQTISTNTYWINGGLTNLSRDTIVLKIAVNTTDTNYSFFTIAPKSKPFPWKWSVRLNKGNNPVLVRALKKNSGAVAAQRAITIFLDENIRDTTGPGIIRILFNNTVKYTGTNLFFPQDATPIRVTVIDASGIADVSANAIKLDSLPGGNDWVTTMPLPHRRTEKLLITTHDNDNKHNESRIAVFAYQNKVPVLKNSISNSVLMPGNTYYDTLWYQDPENDPIEVFFLKSSSWITKGKYICCSPTSQNLGPDSIIFYCSDGLQQSDTATWHFIVIDTMQGVHFSKNLLKTLPGTLQAGTDSLHTILSAGHGTLPYRYSATLVPGNIKLLNSTFDSLLSWHPSVTDTGLYTLFMSVTDASNTKDSLSHTLQVIPRDPPITSLSVVVSPDTLPIVKDTIDASKCLPLTNIRLKFTIHTALRGKYSVSITDKNGIVTAFETDNTSFSYGKKTQINLPVDQITAIVRDKPGNSVTKCLYIKYRQVSTISPDNVADYIWFDASDTTTLINPSNNPCTAGDPVNLWKSKGAVASMQFTAPSSNTQKPQLVGGPNALLFKPSTNTYMSTTQNLDIFKNPYTLFFIAQLDSSNQNGGNAILSTADLNSSYIYGTLKNVGDVNPQAIHFTATNIVTGFLSTYLSVEFKKFQCYCFAFAQTSSSQNQKRLNSKPTISITDYYLNSYSTSMTLGAAKVPAIGYGWQGRISQVLIYKRTLSPDTIKGIENYFSVKYNIPLTP
jgi:hypothetical protein